MNFRILLYLLLCFSTSVLYAQDAPKKSKNYFITTELQLLETTHGTFFKGGDIVIGRTISPRLYLGLGAEYAYCHYHNDNGWNLYNVNFIPVFIDAKFMLKHESTVVPYLELAQGISFVNYRKESQLNLWSPYHVSETGYYIYGGGGMTVKLSKHLKYQLGVGFKSFHMSFNRLDVNPRGSTIRTGIVITL